MNGLLNKNGTLNAKAFRMGYIEHYRLPWDKGEEYSISISMENTIVGGVSRFRRYTRKRFSFVVYGG